MQCQHCCWFICRISGPFARPQFPVRIFLTDSHGLQWIRPLGTEMAAQLASACRLHNELCCKIFVKKPPQSSGFWGEEEQVQPAQTVSLFTWSNCRVQAARISYNLLWLAHHFVKKFFLTSLHRFLLLIFHKFLPTLSCITSCMCSPDYALQLSSCCFHAFCSLGKSQKATQTKTIWNQTNLKAQILPSHAHTQ